MKNKKEYRSYTDEFKWRVVQDVLAGHLTKEEARRVYQIRSKSAILEWMRSFSGVKDYRQPVSVDQDLSIMEKSKIEQEHREEIKRLKQELENERLRGDLWQKIVEVAEEELQLDIKKKFGAKLSQDSKQKGDLQ